MTSPAGCSRGEEQNVFPSLTLSFLSPSLLPPRAERRPFDWYRLSYTVVISTWKLYRCNFHLVCLIPLQFPLGNSDLLLLLLLLLLDLQLLDQRNDDNIFVVVVICSQQSCVKKRTNLQNNRTLTHRTKCEQKVNKIHAPLGGSFAPASCDTLPFFASIFLHRHAAKVICEPGRQSRLSNTTEGRKIK